MLRLARTLESKTFAQREGAADTSESIPRILGVVCPSVHCALKKLRGLSEGPLPKDTVRAVQEKDHSGPTSAYNPGPCRECTFISAHHSPLIPNPFFFPTTCHSHDPSLYASCTMSTTLNTSFIYTGGTRMTRPLLPLPSSVFIDVGATDATRPTLANEDFDALYGTKITPERFIQPLDELSPLREDIRITNRWGLSTRPAIRQPKPVHWNAHPQWLDEYSCTYVQAPWPRVEKTVEALPVFRCAASVLDEPLEEMEAERMLAEVTSLPTSEPRPRPSTFKIEFNPFDDIDDLDTFGRPLTVADSNSSVAKPEDDQDEPIPVTPPWACIDPTISIAKSGSNASMSCASGADFVPTTPNSQHPCGMKTTKKTVVVNHAKEAATPFIAYLREQTRKRKIRRSMKALALSVNGASRADVGHFLETGVRS
ncbi:hypothetical protein NEOLEDRAFT_603340 [Neolentinus lepideus HHB14362 ss-1]|uniref:Uncharacterized protein n=1 Tax=Neolentinus lepideus HHB14362 ss-1 TaxID=1314782 RepID=A0A165VCC7_9AGAM|nr:hypothetical protein NEOLEDRAFT_603340 [Neolentinus lepideus HHB14362 ss-1]